MKRNTLRSGKPERLPQESPRVIEINENQSDTLHQDGKEALLELVWKHFAVEITEILREVQQDLALDQQSAESSPNTKNNFA